MTKLRKALSVILATVLCVALCLGSAYTGVFAAAASEYTIKQMYDDGHIKLLGRTRFEGTNLYSEWAATGFEMNINVPAGGTDLTVKVKNTAKEAIYDDVIIDGDVERAVSERGLAYDASDKNKTEFEFSVHVDEGAHNVRIIRDSNPIKSKYYTHEFISVKFAGTFGEKPADKDKYIEFVGDSYCNGSGTLYPYIPGTSGGTTTARSSILYSYGYVAAELLDADFSIIAMGGYGVLKTAESKGQQEPVSSVDKVDTCMGDLYPYIGSQVDYSHLNTTVEENKVDYIEPYDFRRKADLVVVTLGANDTYNASTKEIFEIRSKELFDLIKEKNGENVPLIFNIPNRTKYGIYQLMMQIAETEEYKNLHPMFLYMGGNGGVAQSSQDAGHMSKHQETDMGRQYAEFIKAEKIFAEEPATPTPAANKVVRYVDGASDGDGTEASPFTYIKDAEVSLKNAIAEISGDDDSISAKIYVMNKQAVEAAPVIDDPTPYDRSLTGNKEVVKSSDGNQITVEIIGIDSEKSGEKPVIYVADAHSITESNGWRRAYNNYRFQNIKVTGSGREGNVSGKVMGAFTAIYANCNTVTFDTGAEFCNAKKNAPFSAENLTSVYGGGATESNNTKTESTAKSVSKANVIINDGIFTNVYTVGLNAVGAYGDGTTDLSKWNYDVFDSDKYYNVTINGGTVSNLYGGTTKLVTGKRANVNITVNGGLVKNLTAAAQTIGDYSQKQYGNFNVNINGGTVNKYVGLTGSSSVVAEYYGKYTFTMRAGNVGTPEAATAAFLTTGEKVTANEIENNIYEGHIYVSPTSSPNEAVYFGGYKDTNVNTVTTNIYGGEIFVGINKGVRATIFFGGSSSATVNTLNNNVTGGRFIFLPANFNESLVAADYITGTGVYFGNYSGSINTINNNIGSGFFTAPTTSSKAKYDFGSLAANSWIGKITNVLGQEGTDISPVFWGGKVYLGSTNTTVGGESADVVKTQLDETDINNMSDEVVIKNTIHGMYSYNAVYCGAYSVRAESYNYHTLGSVETVINSAMIFNALYCGGGEVYGHVKTTINGGTFKDIYGYGTDNANSRTYNGTELILDAPGGDDPFFNQGMRSFTQIPNTSSTTHVYGVYSGSNTAAVVAPLDSTRPALKLTLKGGESIGASSSKACYIYGGSKSGTVNGNIENNLTGGSYDGFFGGSESGAVNGNITNNINDTTIEQYFPTTKAKVTEFTFNYYYCGGSRTGLVTGNIENNVNMFVNNRFYGVSYTSGSLVGNVTNNFNGGAYGDDVYGGTGSGGSLKGDITTNVAGGLFSSDCSFVSGSNINATSSEGKTITNISAPAMKNGTKNVYTFQGTTGGIIANSMGNTKGDVEVNITTGTGNIIPTVTFGPNAGYTLDGNVTVNYIGGHSYNVKAKTGTVTGTKTVNIDLSTGKNTIINGKIGTSDNGEYSVNVKGGTGALYSANSSALDYHSTYEIDTVDTSTGTININAYNTSTVAGDAYVTLPASLKASELKITNNKNLTAIYNEGKLKVVGVSALSGNPSATFTLGDSITGNVLVEKTAVTDELMAKFTDLSYQYEFMGDTVTGYFNASSPLKNIGGKNYYSTDINIPTGKFDEDITFYYSGGPSPSKVFSVNTLLEAGKQQYAGDADSVALFDAMEDYGKEAAYKFYGGEDPQIDYGDMSDLIAKYDVTTQKTTYKYIDGANLRLADKVSVQFYTKLADVSDITKITVNDVETKFTASAVTGLGDYKNVINIPVGVSKMCDAVTVKLYEGDTVVDEYYTSIGHLCKQIINDRSVPSYHNLAKSLLKYIEAADNYFNK